MRRDNRQLSDTELLLMQTLWSKVEPLTSAEIQQNLRGKLDWSLPALMTALSRLCEKGFVNCDRSTRTNYYTALVSEADYKRGANRSFLEKLYDSSVQNFVAALYDAEELTPKDIRELREMLEQYEKEEK